MRLTGSTLAAVAAFLWAAAPASAQVTVANVCHWSGDGWNDETFTLSGLAAPPQAAAGAPITLSGMTASITLAEEVVRTGVRLQVLKAGVNDISVRAWLAIRGENTIEGVQVRDATTTARTTIVLDAEGNYVSSTPLVVTAAFADTAWTSASGAPVSFMQAGAGSLTRLPVRQTRPSSIHVTASLGGLALQIECQPGARNADATAAVPGTAPVFASVAAAPGVVAAPRPAVLALRTSKLRADKQGRVRVRLSCADAPCAGTLRLLRGKTAVTKRVKYALATGVAKTYTLRLTSPARRSLAKRALRVQVAAGDLSAARTLPRRR